MPAIAAVAFGIVGFCAVEVKPFGPVQAYVAPATVEVVSVIVLPVQTGEFEPAVGVAGAVFTVTVALPLPAPAQERPSASEATE